MFEASNFELMLKLGKESANLHFYCSGIDFLSFSFSLVSSMTTEMQFIFVSLLNTFFDLCRFASLVCGVYFGVLPSYFDLYYRVSLLLHSLVPTVAQPETLPIPARPSQRSLGNPVQHFNYLFSSCCDSRRSDQRTKLQDSTLEMYSKLWFLFWKIVVWDLICWCQFALFLSVPFNQSSVLPKWGILLGQTHMKENGNHLADYKIKASRYVCEKPISF